MKKLIIILLTFISVATNAQQNILTLDLQQVIKLATDSSLTAFRYKNMYLANYWNYKSYKAQRLPSLSLNLNPATYNRTLIPRYDSNADMDVYRQQKSYSASGSLAITQNFAPIGGTFYIQTSLDYLRYFGDQTYNQFSSVPIQIGYQHNMFGYNEFKWNKKIEPIKFEKAKLEYLYNTEYIASVAIQYFFALAQAQARYKLALKQADACDSVLIIGERKYKIAAITKSDLLSLRLEAVNAHNSISDAEVEIKRASLNLSSFLGIDISADIDLKLPGAPAKLEIDPKLALNMMHQNSYMILEKMQSIYEAEQNLDRIKKSTRFNANLSASVGFNQQSDKIGKAYDDPMRRDVVSISLSIPLIDWGVGRGQRNNAMNNLNIARIDEQQKILELEQNVIITISELESRFNMISSSEKALIYAEEAYKENIIRFKNGSCDITRLTTSQQQLLTAQNNYVQSMYNYWSCYYDLRRQTLYDFQFGFSLSDEFDFENIR